MQPVFREGAVAGFLLYSRYGRPASCARLQRRRIGIARLRVRSIELVGGECEFFGEIPFLIFFAFSLTGSDQSASHEVGTVVSGV